VILDPANGTEMNKFKHNSENEGANPRDHRHPRHHFLKNAHRDWRVWVVTVLMLLAIAVYVVTDNESLRPGKRNSQPVPASNAP
jgi:uncharacterized integral membrane protein